MPTWCSESGIYKVVPIGEALGNGEVDTAEAGSPRATASPFCRCRFVSAQTVLQRGRQFRDKPGQARVEPSRNLLLVQGTSTERQSAIDAALALDVDWMKNQAVGVFPVRNSSPDTIINELQNVFDSSKEGAATNIVRFQPMARMNAVLAIAQNAKKIDEVGAWIRRLDKADPDNTTVRIYRLRYGNAKIMAGILREVFTGQASTSHEPAGQHRPVAAHARLDLAARDQHRPVFRYRFERLEPHASPQRRYLGFKFNHPHG